MKGISRNTFTLLIIIVFVFLFSENLPAQCAMCKQAAETSLKSNPGSLARGLNSGILYLMAVPYLMILFIFRKQLMQLLMLIKTRFLKKQVK